jgi:hypothetical protein
MHRMRRCIQKHVYISENVAPYASIYLQSKNLENLFEEQEFEEFRNALFASIVLPARYQIN